MPTPNDTTYSIYRIVCFVNGKVYVGRTNNPKARVRSHLSTLKSNRHPNKHLQNAYLKHGSDKFYIEVIEKGIDENDIDQRERFWITYYDSFHNGYNRNMGGSFRTDHSTPCVWNGIEYTSITQAASANSISVNAMWTRIQKGHSCDDEVKLNHSPVTWNGKEYPSIKQAAASNSLKPSTLQARLKAGIDSSDKLANRKIPCEWNGVQYSSVLEASKALGVSKSTMQSRVKQGRTSDHDLGIRKKQIT